VVGYARNLLSGHVVEVLVGYSQIVDRYLEAGRATIVEQYNPESVAGIVHLAGSADRVQNDLIFLSTASDEDIDSRNLVSDEPELRSPSLLQRQHGPEVVHLRGDRHGDLDADEDPCPRKGDALHLLSQDDASNSEAEVRQVQSGIGEGQEGDEAEDPAPPAAPDVGVISLVQTCYRSGLHPLPRESRRWGRAHEICETLMALRVEISRIVLVLLTEQVGQLACRAHHCRERELEQRVIAYQRGSGRARLDGRAHE
jgi:hypothetical protein